MLARELCIDAKRAIDEGRSPAIEKQREKRRILEVKSFGEKWLTAAQMADSTRAMRRSIFERELLPKWRNRLLTEITPDDLRAHCAAIVNRGAPATAIHVRDIVKQIYGFAILHGEKVPNPADDVGPASIATFVPEDRALSPTEIRIMLKELEKVATLPTIRLGMRLFLETMVRKSELQDATWDEVDFENAVWTIPKERMKRSKAHKVEPCLPMRACVHCNSGHSKSAFAKRRQAGSSGPGRPAMRVVQALYWLHNVLPADQPVIVKRLRDLLAHNNRGPEIAADLRAGLSAMPIWMQSIVRGLLTDLPLDTHYDGRDDHPHAADAPGRGTVDGC